MTIPAPAAVPEPVSMQSGKLGRAVPYGIYDLAANAGWVSVGMNRWQQRISRAAVEARIAKAGGRTRH
jgi:Rhodopirellula transposase DDE domain